jgi:cell wall-associated NlpC family hydrolase
VTPRRPSARAPARRRGTPAWKALALALLAAGCATVRAPPAGGSAADGLAPPEGAPTPPAAAGAEGPAPGPPEPGAGDEAGERTALPEADPHARERAAVVLTAARRVGHRFPGDCSAFVLRAYRAAGLAVDYGGGYRSRTEALFHASRPVDEPRPGDLAFFHDTYDRDRNRRFGDRFTHVALVEAVEGAAVVLVHRGRRGIERFRMDLTRPGDPSANDRLRLRRAGDGPRTRYLAGELFAAFGDLLGGEFTRSAPRRRVADTGEGHPAPR